MATSSITIIKEGESNSPLQIFVERTEFIFQREVQPIALPRLQTQILQSSEPVSIGIDIGFMTMKIKLSGFIDQNTKNSLRAAAINWYRHPNTAGSQSFATLEIILNNTATLSTSTLTYTGLLGTTTFTKNIDISQERWRFDTEFLVQRYTPGVNAPVLIALTPDPTVSVAPSYGNP